MKPMKKTRTLAVLLAMLLLSGSLTACGTGEVPPDGMEDSYIPTITEAETVIEDELPDDLDYEDDEITVISRYVEGWTSGEITVEGLMGEPVNDAVFERNKAVEERLNIQIRNIEEDRTNVTEKVFGAVRSGDTDYDFMADACCQAMPYTIRGAFTDLRTSTYLDFEKPWWTQGFHEAVEFKGSQYAVIGAMLLSMYRFGFITVFNKDMFEDADQPFLYGYVEDGTWTLDKQASLIPLFYRDDGNGKRDTTDTYGFASSTYTNIDAYWSACKLDIVKKDENGDYRLVLDMERVHGAVDKILHLFNNTDGGTFNKGDGGDDAIWPLLRRMFAGGHAAMASFRVLELENSEMRNMEEEYGVVPMPKYDEAQDGYYTLLHDQFTVVCVPATIKGEQLDQVSAVLEAMSSASYRIVRPVYYESTLCTKLAQDPQSADMMDIITDNVYIDAGIIFIHALGSYHHSLRGVVKSGTNNTASVFRGQNMAMTRALENMSAKLDQLAARNQKE